MAISYRPPQSSGGGQQPPGGGITNNGFGWFYYNNSLPNQVLSGDSWVTLQNNKLGQFTNEAFSPPGVTSMLDPATGRIMFSELQQGDEVYMRHTMNITPYTNGMQFGFRNLIGTSPSDYAVAFGTTRSLNDGAGVPTGVFTEDTRLFIPDANSMQGGLLSQIYTSSACEVEYIGLYVSVIRRMA